MMVAVFVVNVSPLYLRCKSQLSPNVFIYMTYAIYTMFLPL